MKVAAPSLTILPALAASVAGHASGGEPALMERHARPARPAVSPANIGYINTYMPRSTTGIVSSTSPLTVPTSVSTLPTSSSETDLSATHTGSISGLVNFVSAGSCGPSGATQQITALSGPNGNIDFLNCGLTSGGWTPPLMHVNGIVSVQLSQVGNNPGSVFSACKPFVTLFDKYGHQYGVPPVMLASFAMQESSCNPGTVGGAGEQGLMQITADKCGGAPGGNCQDPDFNIHQAAQFFSQTLDSVNGDLLLAIGQYNGWYKGLTYAEATAARNGNCHEQNNLDYLHQFLNGWMQDINPREHNPPLGKYFNLNGCSN